ncbi:MAG TPA: multicopper oxidase domain-containing protein [Beutenbergiaceae bacterium]|nr:multicopper oxidase domain-containing protein [Beutenbergiaceae bacterium]
MKSRGGRQAPPPGPRGAAPADGGGESADGSGGSAKQAGRPAGHRIGAGPLAGNGPRRGSTATSTTRGVWALRDRPALVWLAAAAVMAVIHPFVPESRWLMVHLVLLGAATHSIMVWSVYFAQALLKTPTALDDRRRQSRRLAVLLIGVSAVLIAVPTALWPLTVAGATLVVGAVTAHFGALWRRLRHALPGRMRVTVHYYLSAAAFLPVGAVLGVLLARGYADPWHGQLLTAHTMVNVLGWVGLTVTGTLITLWPTMLRTRMDRRAERLAKQALPVLIAGLVAVLAGAVTGAPIAVVVGLLTYMAGVIWWGRALVRPARVRPPREFAPASVAAALVWAVVGLVGVSSTATTSSTWGEVTAGFGPVVAVITAGFVVQLLTGAMSYLIPVVLGGGGAVVRTTQWWFNRGGTARLVIINLGLVLFLAPVPSAVRVTTSIAVLVAMVWFIPLMIGSIMAARRMKRRNATTSAGAVTAVRAPRASPAARQATREPFWRGRQVVAGVSALAVAIAVGVGMDPGAAGLPSDNGGSERTPQSATAIAPTGRTTTVQVVAEGMRFTPDHIEVPTGDRLVVELTNADESEVHDLLLGDGHTPRLGPGESATLDAGVISGPTEGWCTIVGHRQMGMVLTVSVTGAPAADRTGPASGPGDVDEREPGDGDAAAGAHAGHGQGELGHAVEGSRPLIVPDEADLEGTIDPELPPLPPSDGTSQVHEVTLTARELELEVAPGVWQRRWTFNGQVPGPTLHGRVGDVFEVTLVNDGSIGHSIDFHAGSLAPDEPMRTIPPGESLVYRFTAQRAGIWLYHCGTDPMSSHIAAGMFGAVVIEPEDLDPVDRSYVLVQSEAYLQAERHTRGEAAEVDADRAGSGPADVLSFNGIGFQYRQQPLEAQVGERVRFWVLNAGPNRAGSFHIVGAQFDTVYLEGAYHLRRGEDAFGNTGGGSQALSVAVAQGGFVETVFPETGHYPMVTHVMADAERGASGVVAVSE